MSDCCDVSYRLSAEITRRSIKMVRSMRVFMLELSRDASEMHCGAASVTI